MSFVTVIGEGAWGTAMATLLAENDHTVFLWCHDSGVKKDIETMRCNHRYLPGIALSNNIIPITNINDALAQSSWVFEAIPVKFLRAVLSHVDPILANQKSWVILSKGIEKDSLLFPTQLVDELFGKECSKLVLFGPSFAQELAQKQITGVILATENKTLGLELQKLLDNAYFKTFMSSDVLGVQIVGALKNVIALAMGMLDGAGYSDNTKAFFLTRSLYEMALFALAFGAQNETVYGLAGLGDLVLTSLGNLSRNVMVGKRLGRGDTLDIILCETGAIPEGINTLESMHQLIIQKELKLPLLISIYDVVFNGLPLQDFVNNLIK